LPTTPSNTYRNTARAQVVNFVQSLAPSPAEAPYLACILKKSGLSMRDAKTLCDFIASRASHSALQSDSIAALGLPSLPQQNAPAAAQSAV
jgi:hypothetical protein